MVFQNYALYPHMSVFENMSFGLRMRKVPRAEIDARVRRAADILNIGNLLNRRPRQLSGGQRQRVAMGRAMVRQPRVFLLDEPLSNLDAKLRLQMRTEIKRVRKLVRTTTIYVTHDQIEAMTLADRIVIMNEGRIEQVASPQEMYDRPSTRFVAGFIGSPGMNFLPCGLEDGLNGLSVRLDSNLALKVPESRWPRYRQHVGTEMIFGIRPEHITERRAHTHPSQVDFTAEVGVLEPTGIDTMVHFKIGGKDVWARASPGAVNEAGTIMEFTLDMNHMHLFDSNSDRVH
jgi:multiple sugar transport system ATP-binding protein